MKYTIDSLSSYCKFYDKSIEKPEKFWEKIAEEFVWDKKWKTVLDYDFETAEIAWFLEGKTNLTSNCIDRHLVDKANQTAIIFEPNNPEEEAQHISYKTLAEKVNQVANSLKSLGIQKGDRVCIYLPMIPELAYTVLACARIGAIHSVVFAGFSSQALASRVNDAACKVVVTADGGFRGDKVIDLKSIVDKGLTSCNSVEKVIVVKRTGAPIEMDEQRDCWMHELVETVSSECDPEVMDAESPLFILYTSGSTGMPKGMVHTTGGYMVYAGYTFKNVFNYKEGDVYWCTADIGWITGHSYILYGPLLNGATTVLFEGVPSFPDYNRFWEVVEKHKVNQFYTAPTAIRALAKEPLVHVSKHDLSSLKVLGTVGEPINTEAWEWYDVNIGKRKCPIVDTWWQTETGGILISPIPFVTPTKPTFATLPLPGVQPVLVDAEGKVVEGNDVSGNLCISFPWPGIARTIWGNHQRYVETYFSAYPGKYFSGDGAKRDKEGYYRITGRVDDVVIVSGHNLGTAPIEDAINTHEIVAESAIVGYPHEVKGSALYGYITLKVSLSSVDQTQLKKEINQLISQEIGPIAKLDIIHFTEGLPKTRSGKIMRRILRKIAANELSSLGDVSTLLNPEVVDQIIATKA